MGQRYLLPGEKPDARSNTTALKNEVRKLTLVQSIV